MVNNAELIINARVHADPETLLALVRRGLEQVCRRRGLTANLDKIQHFRPARPVPTYRFAADAGYQPQQYEPELPTTETLWPGVANGFVDTLDSTHRPLDF